MTRARVLVPVVVLYALRREFHPSQTIPQFQGAPMSLCQKHARSLASAKVAVSSKAFYFKNVACSVNTIATVKRHDALHA